MPNHAFKRSERRLEIELSGRIDEAEAERFLAELRDELGSFKSRPLVVIDLERLVDSTILARAKLVEAQVLLGERAKRTAWISKRPRFRGLALLVCHGSEDPNAKVLPTRAQAEQWLASSFDRVKDIGPRVESRLDEIRARLKRGGR